jgi:hypothetical protein
METVWEIFLLICQAVGLSLIFVSSLITLVHHFFPKKRKLHVPASDEIIDVEFEVIAIDEIPIKPDKVNIYA